MCHDSCEPLLRSTHQKFTIPDQTSSFFFRSLFFLYSFNEMQTTIFKLWNALYFINKCIFFGKSYDSKFVSNNFNLHLKFYGMWLISPFVLPFLSIFVTMYFGNITDILRIRDKYSRRCPLKLSKWTEGDERTRASGRLKIFAFFPAFYLFSRQKIFTRKYKKVPKRPPLN